MTFSISKWRKKAIAMYGKARGLSADARKKVTAAVHGKTYKASRSTVKPRKTSMPRRGRSFFSTRTVFRLIRLGALAAPGLMAYQKNKNIGRSFGYYAGIDDDGKFRWKVVAYAWTPYLAATLITYGIPKLAGILRRL